MPSLLHQIRRSRGNIGDTISGKIPLTPLPIGTALMIDTNLNADGSKNLVLAQGRCDGFLTRDSRAQPGLTDTEQLFGFGLETPFFAGFEGSIEDGEELDVEGSDYVLGTGTGAITNVTAAGTDLSFKDGKFYIAQTNDLAQYKLLNAALTPNIAGNTRILVVKIKGYKK